MISSAMQLLVTARSEATNDSISALSVHAFLVDMARPTPRHKGSKSLILGWLTGQYW